MYLYLILNYSYCFVSYLCAQLSEAYARQKLQLQAHISKCFPIKLETIPTSISTVLLMKSKSLSSLLIHDMMTLQDDEGNFEFKLIVWDPFQSDIK